MNPSFKEIVEAIVAEHHSFLRRELPRLSTLLSNLEKENREKENSENSSLREAQQLYKKIKSKIEAHLHDEETLLFPTGIALESGSSQPASEINLLERLQEMEKEHDGCTNALGTVAVLLSELPESATHDAVIEALAAMQADLRIHVEKENSMVHPRFLQLFMQENQI